MADFMEEIDQSLRLPHQGEIVTGTVEQVNDEEVIVNMHCKKDGILRANEVTLEEGQKLTDLFQEGDEVKAKVIRTDDNDGGIMLSKKRLEVNEHWKEIDEALENKANIEVKVVRVVKGGVIAAYKDVQGFIPLSQLSNRYVESADEFVGQVLTVKVSRVDQKRQRAVFSHKAVLQEERQKKLDIIWQTLKVDDIVEGTVMRFTDYGAFVDLGGIDGLLHISEISWGKLRHPEEVLEIGQKIHVKILNMNREKGKISLGLKQTTPEPWSVIDENYHVGEVVEGKVVQLKEYGAFVELEPGLDGLVHISEVANKHVNNIGDELTVGQKVMTKILDIDTDRKRISLSIKQVPENQAAEEKDEEAQEDAE
jgi:4-hydroxy-3-methylbut-2-enyl diphosphate reductase